MKNQLLPKYTMFVCISAGLSLLVFFLLRVIFLITFFPHNDPPSLATIIQALFIGLKFDLRLTLLLHLPVLALGWIRPIHITTTRLGRGLWLGYLTTATFAVLLSYFIDFGHFAYLETRLNATALRFLRDAGDSLRMIVETYHVAWLSLLLAVVIVMYAVFLNVLLKRTTRREKPAAGRWRRVAAMTVFVLVYLFGIYGKFSYYPLRWSDAFFSTHTFASSLAINPVLYFFETLKNREPSFDFKTVQAHYDMMANYLGVENKDPAHPTYLRRREGNRETAVTPNVVVVILESFAYYKTGVSGNPMDPTPRFDKLAEKGLLFTRFYTPHGGTARSVFTATTGIPDVELVDTSTRNPMAVNQRMIINDFKGYEKFYFLGGSASWGNIRGLLKHNIKGLQIHEEGSYDAPRVDVWGISDLHLFEAANRIFRNVGGKPFFAIIQTSGNHRPYTIPDDNRGFVKLEKDDSEVAPFGFRSTDDYNAFRFMDHSIGFFMDAAAREPYFQNTIFVFFGDHGNLRRADHMPKSEIQLGLTDYHVPLLIYAPGRFREGRREAKVASEVDVMPTLAGLAGIPYRNTTFGRDLLDPKFDDTRNAFTIFHTQVPEIGLISQDYYFLTRADGKNRRLNAIHSERPRDNLADRLPKEAAAMETLCRGIYETAKYIRFHNAPERSEAPTTTSRQNAN